MKALLITAAAGLLLAGAQQYRIATRDTEIATLKAQVQAHNDAAEALKTAGQLENSEASGRVTEVMLEGEKKKRTLPAGYGPAVMNNWFDEAFP